MNYLRRNCIIVHILLALLFLVSFSVERLHATELPRLLWDVTAGPVLRGDGILPLVDAAPDVSHYLKDGTRRGAYHYQQSAMILTLAATRYREPEWLADVYEGLEAIRDGLSPIHTLREQANAGAIDLDDFFLSPSRSGPSNKRVFGFKGVRADGTPFVQWNDIAEKQIAAYVGFAVAELSSIPTAPEQQQRLVEWIDFLVIEYLYMLGSEFEGWHWNGAFETTIERMEAKVQQPLPNKLTRLPYGAGWLDAEWWIMATAGYTARAISQLGVEDRYSADALESIHRILHTAKLSFEQRLADNEYFDYDVGYWNGRGEHDWALYLSTRFPDEDAPPGPWNEAVIDSAHSNRLPWLLLALENGDAANRLFYRELRRRLSRQFADRMLYYEAPGHPRITNYTSGLNGWYALNYDRGFGFGPGDLSWSLTQGAWATLGAFEESVQKVYQDLRVLSESHVPSDVAFRTRSYGRIVHPLDGQRRLQASEDVSGPGSLSHLRFLLIDKMIKLSEYIPELTVVPDQEEIVLSWAGDPSASSFVITRSNTTGDTALVEYRLSNTLSFVDSQIDADTSYTYTLRAYNEFASSLQSEPVEVDTFTRYQVWSRAFELGETPLTTDVDLDGRTQLMEYAVYSNPLESDRESILELEFTSSEPGKVIVSLPPLRKSADVAYSLAASADLQSWTEVGYGNPIREVHQSTRVVESAMGELTVIFDPIQFDPGGLYLRFQVEFLGVD